MSSQQLWWRDGVVYQIYPRSFQDSNGDGIGDLPGIESRLDYLVELGVDAIWISPFYPSPMADFGYDVSDYTGVDPIFGSLADFDRLIAAAHARGLKLILDFVPNHSSDQHPWFLESRSSRQSPKRDWYLWRDPAPGVNPTGPPNNWMSNFGGSGWTFDDATGQFYFHSFLKQQPDLNWHNPELRQAIYAAMRFWLDRGVDGFRMDVLWLLAKDPEFRNNPPNPEWTPGASDFWSVLPTYTADQPETHAIVAEMRQLLDQYPERVLIGEIYLPVANLVAYYGKSLQGAHMPFNFHLIQTEWNADKIAHLIRDYEAALPEGAWPNWVMGNHDQSRAASRIGRSQARAAAMLLLTLRGTPTLYYGEELGMTNGPIAPQQVQDTAEKLRPGIGLGRDPQRTPMLWNASEGAGFTTATPWLPINPGLLDTNVATESADPQSMLSLYRRLLALRQTHPALHAGAIHDVQSEQGVLSFIRSFLDAHTGALQQFQIVLNLTADIQTIHCEPGHIALTTILDGDGAPVGGPLIVEAGEGLLIRLQ
ncbi:MAG TPA: alpha-amylase family glycosyl hydrolase [Granulicella sp.]|jgi:alpha-glucosidase|nr:alpha-amylase family glycosyl hydrolase [Granulicella sp.]